MISEVYVFYTFKKNLYLKGKEKPARTLIPDHLNIMPRPPSRGSYNTLRLHLVFLFLILPDHSVEPQTPLHSSISTHSIHCMRTSSQPAPTDGSKSISLSCFPLSFISRLNAISLTKPFPILLSTSIHSTNDLAL